MVNTERERRKTRNVEKITTEGARDHIDTLAKRRMDEDEYPHPIQSEHVILKIALERVYSGI